MVCDSLTVLWLGAAWSSCGVGGVGDATSFLFQQAAPVLDKWTLQADDTSDMSTAAEVPHRLRDRG